MVTFKGFIHMHRFKCQLDQTVKFRFFFCTFRKEMMYLVTFPNRFSIRWWERERIETKQYNESTVTTIVCFIQYRQLF